MGRSAVLGSVLLGSVGLGCLPGDFDDLAELAPVTTLAVDFIDQADVSVAVALTVPADDEGRGRVLFGDGAHMLGWLRLDERHPEFRYATHMELAALVGYGQEPPSLTGLAVVETLAVAEGLVRVAPASTTASDEAAVDPVERVVRFRVADFSRPSPAEHDMRVYPWVDALWTGDGPARLSGPLAAVELDEGLPEGLSGSELGLVIWDALGTRASEYEGVRELLLADDSTVFDADPSQGWGLTWCPALHPTVLAGGRVLAGQRRAALALEAATVTFVGLADAAPASAVGAPQYDCELATLTLPGPATSLIVADLDHDGADELLVGAPELGEVWVYANSGEGLASEPSLVLRADAGTGGADPTSLEFGAAIAHVELGGTAPDVIAVGARKARVAGKAEVGRVFVFDAQTGELLRTLEDLAPRSGSLHGLGVHGVDLPGREELLVTGAREIRIHWSLLPGDPRP